MFHKLLGPVLASTSRRVIVLHRSQQSSLCKHANSRCSTRFWALSLRRRPDESSSSIAGNKALFANMPILDVALRHKPCMQHETNIQVYSLLLYESTWPGHHVPQASGPCPCVDVPTSHRPPSQPTKTPVANMSMLHVALRHNPCMQNATATITSLHFTYKTHQLHLLHGHRFLFEHQDTMFDRLLSSVLSSAPRRIIVLNHS